MPTTTTGRQSGHVQIMRGVTERERRRDRQSGRGTPLVPTVFSAEGHQNGVRAALLTDAPLISQECTGGSPERGKSSFNLGNELPRFDSSSTSTRRDYFPMPASLRPHSPSMRTKLARGGPQVGRHTGRTPILWLISGETPPNPASPPQELLTAQNSMGGPPQYPGSRLGGGYVAPENNISSAAVNGPRGTGPCSQSPAE